MLIEAPKTKRHREPFFGEGAMPFIRELAVLALSLGLFLLVSTIGVRSYRNTGVALFGEPQRVAPTLQPGESAVVNGVTIKRID